MKSTINLLLVAVLFCLTTQLSAQEAGKLRGTIDFGVIVGPNIGAQLGLEPKYNLSNRASLGLRFEFLGFNGRDISLSDPSWLYQRGLNSNNGTFIAGTYESYFGKKGKRFQPFWGAGIGYFKMSGTIDIYSNDGLDLIATTTSKGNIGGLLRVGFQWGKFRYTWAYTHVPTTDLKAADGTVLGSTKDYYVHFNIGYSIGGGKWRNLDK